MLRKLTDVANPRNKELDAVSNDLVARNIFLEPEFQQYRQKIRTLEDRILEMQGMQEMRTSPKKIGSGSLDDYPDNPCERTATAENKLVKSSHESSQVGIEMNDVVVVKKGRKQGKKGIRQRKELAIITPGLDTAT